MRTLLDTCVIIDWATDPQALDDGVWDIIISHAITERLTLISSDEKFPFYRNQGLDLIEY